MASAWGNSWGNAWGNAWGRLAVIVIDTHDGGKREFERIREAKDRLREQIMAAMGYPQIVPELAEEVQTVEREIKSAVTQVSLDEVTERVMSILRKIRQDAENDDEEAIMLLVA